MANHSNEAQSLSADARIQPAVETVGRLSSFELAPEIHHAVGGDPHNRRDGATLVAERQASAATVEGLGFPRLEADLVRDIHKVEDRYVFDHDNSRPPGERRAAEMRRVWRETSDFADRQPQDVPALVRDLQSQDLLSQISIAALEQAIHNKEGQTGRRIDQLLTGEAVALIDRQDALGDAIRQHLQTSMRIEPGRGFGGGYSDFHSGVTVHHIDQLMRDFSHPPNYLSTEAQEAKARQQSILPSWLGGYFGR